MDVTLKRRQFMRPWAERTTIYDRISHGAFPIDTERMSAIFIADSKIQEIDALTTYLHGKFNRRKQAVKNVKKIAGKGMMALPHTQNIINIPVPVGDVRLLWRN